LIDALLFPGKGNTVPTEYTRYVICRRMGWDYHTYLAQPAFFIDEIVECMQAEDHVKNVKQAQLNKK